jgi:hypothetical protein
MIWTIKSCKPEYVPTLTYGGLKKTDPTIVGKKGLWVLFSLLFCTFRNSNKFNHSISLIRKGRCLQKYKIVVSINVKVEKSFLRVHLKRTIVHAKGTLS